MSILLSITVSTMAGLIAAHLAGSGWAVATYGLGVFGGLAISNNWWLS